MSRPPKRKTPEEMAAEVGMSSEALYKIAKETQIPEISVRREVTQKRHDYVVGCFDRYIRDAKGGSVSVGGERVRSLDDWVARGLPFPTRNPFVAWFKWYAGDVQKRGRGSAPDKKMLAGSLFEIALTFATRWNVKVGPRSSLKVSKNQRKEMLIAVAIAVRDLELPTTPLVKADLDKESVSAMLDACLDPELDWDFGQRIHVAFFIAMAEQSGLRPSTICLGRGMDPSRTRGAKFGSFLVWLSPPVDSTSANELDAYFKTSDDEKTTWTENKFFPIPTGPSLLKSTIHLLLLELWLRGGVELSDLRRVATANLDKPIILDLPENSVDQRVLSDLSSGQPIRTPWITKKLVEISIHLGFEVPVTSYRFRHHSAQSLEAAGLSIDDIRIAMTHDPKATATKRYLLGLIPFSGTGAIAGLDPSLDQALKAKTATVLTRVDVNAPKRLDESERQQVYAASKKVQALVDKLSTARAEGQGADAIAKLREKVWGAEKGAAVQGLKDKRAKYFEDRRHAGPSAFAATTETTAVRHPTTSRQSNWDKHLTELLSALHRPPSDFLLLIEVLQKVEDDFPGIRSQRGGQDDDGEDDVDEMDNVGFFEEVEESDA